VERALPEICWRDTTLIADKTVQFGWDGVDYEIDLTAEHADEFADAMARYVDLARKVKRKGSAETLSGSTRN
jgi:hypothetical protein